MHWWWPLSVCLSVCTVPEHKLRTEGRSKLKIGRKKVHDAGDPWLHYEVEMLKVKVSRFITVWPKISHIFGPYLHISHIFIDLRTSHVLQRWSTRTRITDMRGDLQAQSSRWLFKSPLAGGGGILWRPHYRPHSLFHHSWGGRKAKVVGPGSEKRCNATRLLVRTYFIFVLINDLKPDCLVHKYVDDTTLTELFYDCTKHSSM